MNTNKHKQTETTNSLCHISDILVFAAFSRSHLYGLIAKGHFPKPAIRYGRRFTRWRAHEVQEWLSDPQGWIDRQDTNKGAKNVA